MEDILASIRRIIAEDPPGSRPAASTPAPPTPAPAPARPMQRLEPAGFSGFGREPDLSPVVSHEPERPQPAEHQSFQRGARTFAAAFPASPAPAFESRRPHHDVYAERVEPALPEPTQRNGEADKNTPAPADRIEAQLNDLLGDELQPLAVEPTLKVPVASTTEVLPGSNSGMGGGAPGHDFAFGSPSLSATSPTLSASLAVAAAETSSPPSSAPMSRPADPDFSALGRASRPSSGVTPEARPGFTVSRVGYLAEQQAADPVPAEAVVDPFEFKLGPSPFARGAVEQAQPPDQTKSEPATALENAQTRSFASDIDALIAEVTSKTAASADKPADDALPSQPVTSDGEAAPAAEGVAVESNPAASVSAVTGFFASKAIAPEPAVAASSESEPEVVVQAEAATEPDTAVAAAVAVEADVIETAPAAEASVEAPVVQEAVAPAEPARAPTIDLSVKSSDKLRDILPLVPNPSTAVESDFFQQPPTTLVPSRSIAQTEYLSASPALGAALPPAPVTSSSQLPAQRATEDALAELLRPMLRSWLAENMPKIVERALRQELAGKVNDDQKTAAE